MLAEEDRAKAIMMHNKLGEERTCISEICLRLDRHTDTLVTILRFSTGVE